MTKNQTAFYPVEMPREERVRRNKPLVEIIIALLDAKREFQNNPIQFGYLLNQAVRQYIIPQDHWHISEAAKKVWDSITDDDIRKFTFQQQIDINKLDDTMEIGESIIIEEGKKTPFNKIFISEHITPVSDVIKVLENHQSPLCPDDVMKILDKMHIARILQSENKEIEKRNNRWTDFSDIPDCKHIVDQFYHPAGIYLVELKYSKQ